MASRYECVNGEVVLSVTNSLCQLGTVCRLPHTGELQIFPKTRGPTQLQWDLTRIPAAADWPGPLEVAIDHSHVGLTSEEPWTEIAEYADRGELLTIEDQQMFGSEFNSHYRIRIRNALGDIYTTKPVSVFDTIPPRLKSTYREAVRRWDQRKSRGELRIGALLKRRRWGVMCPTCRDRDGGQQLKSRCLTCYDTGFDGGYYVGDRCFGAAAVPSRLSTKFDIQRGHSQTGPETQFLFLNVPQLFPGDVWIDTSTDERWLLGSPMQTTMRLGDVQLFRALPASRLDSTHVIYDFDYES